MIFETEFLASLSNSFQATSSAASLIFDPKLSPLADALVAIEFYALPLAIWYWIYRRKNAPFQRMLLLLSLLTFFIATTHVVAVGMWWYPFNQFLMLIKIITAAISWPIALQIISGLPQVLAIASPRQLEKANLALQREIQERQQAEAGLRNSEELLRVTFEQAAIGIARVGLQGEWLQVNQALCNLLGYSREELLQLRCQDLTCRDCLKNNADSIERLLSREISSSSLERYLLRKDGTHVWVHFSVSLVRDSDNEPVYFIAVIEDITARKQAEAEIKKLNQQLEQRVQERTAQLQQINKDLKSEINKCNLIEQQLHITQERLQFLLSSSPGAIYTSKATGDYGATYMSQTIKSITGYQACEFVEQSEFWAVRVHPDDVQKTFAQLSGVLETGTEILEYRFLHKNGTYRWIRDELKLLCDQTHQSTELIGYMIDITERKQIEEALRESEERFRLMANSAPVLIWMANAEGKCTFLNQVGLDFTGRSLQEELAEGWLANVHPDDLPRLLESDPSKSQRRDPFLIEFRLRRWDGEYRWMLNKGVPRMTADGNFSGYIGSCIDITERKQAEEQLFTLNLELLQSNRELEQFAYVASHDLQEPLRMVSLFTQLLAQKYENNLDEDTQTYIHYILDAATTMQQLIKDLLAYSQVGTSKSQGNFQPIDCNQVLQKVLQNLQLAIAESHAIINSTGLPTVIADEQQLVILLQNLIGNAIKYCHPDVVPHIEIKAEPYTSSENQRQWCFSVQDNGIGIQSEYFERIFKIFQRLHHDQEYPGTGIGLAICQKIVERHGGRIWVESEVDKGSTFYFTFPY
ncbi:MAG: PAS domain S-box protein [Lyngbya sp.]|nr:PAS domain S-box protein [Lyngbya sp.]